MEKKSIDPYKMLNVPRNYTLDQLKNAYRNLVMITHPDKGGSEYMFNLATASFKYLLREFKKKQNDKQFDELKVQFKKETKYVDTQPSKGFNIDRFNSVFDEHHTPHNESGYGDFLKNTKPIDEPKKIFKNSKVSNETFNEVFEKQTNQLLKQKDNKFITKYKEPEALVGKGKVSYTELGVDDTGDYSADNMGSRRLNFMDLKIAHTTSRIVDPSTVSERVVYKTFKDLENARGNIKYAMDDEEKNAYEQKQKMEALLERERLKKIEQDDILAGEKFKKLHNLLI